MCSFSIRTPPFEVSLSHLRGRWRVSITRQDLEGDAATAVLQQLLQLLGVAAHLAPVHLADDVAGVQHSLPVDHGAVEDPRDDQFTPLHPERHALTEITNSFRV